MLSALIILSSFLTLLQGQSTCPCRGGSCPQPCFTASSERSKSSTKMWEQGWRTWCISESCSPSAVIVAHQLWGLHSPHKLAAWENRLWSVAKTKWNICFNHHLRGLYGVNILSCIKQEGGLGVLQQSCVSFVVVNHQWPRETWNL